MVTNEFADASSELIEILKYLPQNEVEKVPQKLRSFFTKVANKNYVTKIDPNKSMQEQEIKEKTKDLIAVLYRNYWCSEEERTSLDKKLIENDKKYEEMLREKYNPDNIFEVKAKEKEEHKEEIKEEKELVENTTQEMIKYTKLNFLQKIFEKIKSFFKRK